MKSQYESDERVSVGVLLITCSLSPDLFLLAVPFSHKLISHSLYTNKYYITSCTCALSKAWTLCETEAMIKFDTVCLRFALR